MTLPDPNLAWPIPMGAVAMVAESEGLRLKAYLCPAGVPTIGWGHTGPDVVLGKSVVTKEQADALLLEDINESVSKVRSVCAQMPPNENQLGALVSFAFNCKGWETSTVVKCHNKGDFLAASRAFSLWNKARVSGQLTVLPGLTARRAAEAALYLQPDPEAPREKIPQAVEAESPVTSSPIVQGGATTAGAGILAGLAEAKDFLGPVGEWFKSARTIFADAVGIPPSWVLPAVLIIAGVVVIRWRLAQRKQGWA